MTFERKNLYEKIFYARISTKDQTLERQIVEAKKLGIDEGYIFLEVASGKDFKRPEYRLLKRMFREGGCTIHKIIR